MFACDVTNGVFLRSRHTHTNTARARSCMYRQADLSLTWPTVTCIWNFVENCFSFFFRLLVLAVLISDTSFRFYDVVDCFVSPDCVWRSSVGDHTSSITASCLWESVCVWGVGGLWSMAVDCLYSYSLLLFMTLILIYSVSVHMRQNHTIKILKVHEHLNPQPWSI